MPTAMTRIAVARIRAFAPALFVFTLPGLSCAVAQPSALGFFDGQTDVGHNASRGDAGYNAATNTYTLTSNGANTWYHVDNFHFVWKKTSGDQTLTADIRFPSPAYTHEPNPHRKGISKLPIACFGTVVGSPARTTCRKSAVTRNGNSICSIRMAHAPK